MRLSAGALVVLVVAVVSQTQAQDDTVTRRPLSPAERLAKTKEAYAKWLVNQDVARAAMKTRTAAYINKTETAGAAAKARIQTQSEKSVARLAKYLTQLTAREEAQRKKYEATKAELAERRAAAQKAKKEGTDREKQRAKRMLAALNQQEKLVEQKWTNFQQGLQRQKTRQQGMSKRQEKMKTQLLAQVDRRISDTKRRVEEQLKRFEASVTANDARWQQRIKKLGDAVAE